ncbi:hypothetical protein BCR39DRAFT_227063 [Naematelia encephala]|uniref:[histone H3]-trimethyl-L-lysine(9) demethylase n=1 Tax=Naematelia encephala TaxID=71784 RepID=A0A1Y2AY37_9TREE|nr:hypothetical protein BCR39DRAFT_227063 [Naematelia encephala]
MAAVDFVPFASPASHGPALAASLSFQTPVESTSSRPTSTVIAALDSTNVPSTTGAASSSEVTGSPIRKSARPRKPKTFSDSEITIPIRTSTLDEVPKLEGPRMNPKLEEQPPAPKLEEPLIGPGFLQPDSFYPLNNHQTNLSTDIDPVTGYAYGAEGIVLSPEDDKMAERGIPIFRPTMEEFADFEGYVTKTVPWGQYSGITKIIPPKEWVETCPPISKERLASVQIRSPIQQNMLGTGGLFRQTNVEKRRNRPFSIEEWFSKCQSSSFAAPGPKEGDRAQDRDSKEARERRAAEMTAVRARQAEAREKRLAAAKRKAERISRGESTIQSQLGDDNPGEPSEPGPSNLTYQEEQNSVQSVPPAGAGSSALPPLDPSHQASPQSSPDPIAKTPDSRSSASDIPEWYETFAPTQAWLPKDTVPEDYTPERCAALERRFWRSMGISEPSWYGADGQGSLFEDVKTPWNVAHLPNLLNRLGETLPGVNVPYLYWGMWRAAFAWHVEDMDLFSINYIHFGAPKFWYAVPQMQAEKFERILRSYFPQEAESCDQFLRHKSFTVSPTLLAKDGVRVNMLVHNQNEFVITYPRGYHAGFNMGFNCAESVNFALDSWLELGRRAKVCECVSHSVRIDVDELLATQEKNMRTQEKLSAKIREERKASRKRLSEFADDSQSRKVRRDRAHIGSFETQSGEGSDYIDADTDLPIRGLAKKRTLIALDGKPKVKRAPPIVKPKVYYPCVLCPSTAQDDLVPVWQPGDHVKSMCKSSDGMVRAHISCVNAIAEIAFDDYEVEGKSETFAIGINDIPKDRWNLKCASCEDRALAKSGAKIQCTKGKCPKAFHVSCAKSDENVKYNLWEVTEYEAIPAPDDAVDGTPQFIPRTVFKPELLCPQHNPEAIERKKQRAAEELRDNVLRLLPGQTIKLKLVGASIEVELLQVFEQEKRVGVKQSDGYVVHFESGLCLRLLRKRYLCEWSRIDFKPTVAKPLQSGNEYSKQYTHTRKQSDVQADGPQQNFAPHIQQPQLYPVRLPAPRQQVPPIHPAASLYAHVEAVPPQFSSQPQGRLSVEALCRPPTRPMHIDNRVVVVDSQRQFYDNRFHPYAPYQQVLPTRSAPITTSSVQCYRQPAHASPLPTMPFLTRQAYPQLMSSSTLPTPPYHTPRSSFTGSAEASSSSQPAPVRSSDVRVPQSSASTSASAGRIDLGLGRMRALMTKLPPLTVPAIHIAGTNGKGSVSAMLESCLISAGLKVARYNSPHLVEPRDAIRIDGQPPSLADYNNRMEEVRKVAAASGIEPTTFELATAAAFCLINQSGADVMIVECGMGGARDATNVLPPDIVLASALCAVGFDHTSFLGDTIAAITEEKAAISVNNGLLFVAPQSYLEVIVTARRVASNKGARMVPAGQSIVAGESSRLSLVPFSGQPCRTVRTTLPSYPESNTAASPPIQLLTVLSLPGKHQLDNLSLALTMLHVLRQDRRALSIQPKLSGITDGALRKGIAATRWEGRCSWVEWTASGTNIRYPILVDGAHNRDSARTLRAYIDEVRVPTPQPNTFIISLSSSKDKTVESVLVPLIRPGDRIAIIDFTTPVEGMPWVAPVSKQAVFDAVRAITGELSEIYVGDGQGVSALQGALKWAVKDWDTKGPGLVVVCGSLYLVADVYRLIRGL